jgi:hypothetical protein
MKYERTIQTPAKRHYKDPDLVRSARTMAMNDKEFDALEQAAKLAGMKRGEFAAAMARDYITLHELRKAEKNFSEMPGRGF